MAQRATCPNCGTTFTAKYLERHLEKHQATKTCIQLTKVKYLIGLGLQPARKPALLKDMGFEEHFTLAPAHGTDQLVVWVPPWLEWLSNVPGGEWLHVLAHCRADPDYLAAVQAVYTLSGGRAANSYVRGARPHPGPKVWPAPLRKRR